MFVKFSYSRFTPREARGVLVGRYESNNHVHVEDQRREKHFECVLPSLTMRIYGIHEAKTGTRSREAR